MKDQAEGLRVKLRRQVSGGSTKAIAVVSGKGGVGKSNFSLNFAISLTKRRYKVLLFDMDVGMGNLDILMGKSSERTIVDYLRGTARLSEIVTEGPQGLKYVGGGTGLSQLVQLDRLGMLSEELDTFLEEYDYLIFDMGAGANEDTLNFLLSVHEIFVITTPEPTSIMDAYAMMKYLHLLDSKIPFYLVANRAQSVKEGKETIDRLADVLRKFLQRESRALGILPDDRSVQKAVLRQVPFVLDNPRSAASAALEGVVNRYLSKQFQETAQMKSDTFVSKLKKILFAR
ncbi:MinD/ParA family protein [Neobacillus sp. SM06]|uniref:MinD/ParA family protein n=1 Tax=Neobacillus sp. SM06 TaxID=3422492 RepID=UPI003D2CBA73